MSKGKRGLKMLCLICFLTIQFICSCRRSVSGTCTYLPLYSDWQFHKSGNEVWFPAHVPGTLISDLWNNKKIEEVSLEQARIVYMDDWEYSTVFNVPKEIMEHDMVQLCFDGLDTYALVYLNDTLILKADSKLRQWKINCKHLLKAKENQLKVSFPSPLKRKGTSYVDSVNKFRMPQAYHADAVPLSCRNKKKPFSLGRGIWRPVYLKAWSVADITDQYLQPVSIDPKKAEYIAHISVTAVQDITLEAELLLNEKEVIRPVNLNLKKGENVFQLKFSIEKPRLWWPNGMGNSNLYDAILRLRTDRDVICETHQRLGVRSIEMVKPFNSDKPDFYFKINGVPLFIKGAGYISANTVNHPSEANYTKIVEDAYLANFNMLRVYSNGIYENDIFYNECDEKGILIWQDFIVEPFDIQDTSFMHIKQETIENIKRLRRHPCLALWWGSDQFWNVGNSEVSDNTKRPGKPDHKTKLFQEVFPGLVKEYASSVIYLNESFFRINKNIEGIDILNGHMTGSLVTNYGIPSFGTLKYPFPAGSMIFTGTVEDIYNDIKSTLQNKDLSEYIKKKYNQPKNFDSEVYITRLAQAEIMKSTIENHRRHMPLCMGSLYEKLNDFRAGISPSTITLSGWWKPAHYAVKNAFSHILVIPVKENGMVNIYASSDALKDMDAILLARLINFTGDDLYVKQIPVKIKTNTSSLLLSIKEAELLRNTDRAQSCLVVQLNLANKTISQNILYFTEPKNLSLSKPEIELNANETLKGYNLILKSPVLAKNVFIETISKASWFSDNNIDLLPGKRTKINVRYSGTGEELLRDIRIKSLADIK